MSDGLGDAPCHVAVVERVAAEGYTRINQPDRFGGHPGRARGALQGGGDWIQGLDGLELGV